MKRILIMLLAALLLGGCAVKPNAAGTATITPVEGGGAAASAVPEPVVAAVTEKDAAINAMLPVLDSVLRTMGVRGGSAYAPEDPEFFWSVLYLTGVNWSASRPEIRVVDGVMLVPENVMKEIAGAAFQGNEQLLPLPKDYPAATYDEATKTYKLMASDVGASQTRLETCQAQDGDHVRVTLGLYVEPDERYGAVCFTLKRNQGTGYPYCVVDAQEDTAPFIAWQEVDPAGEITADLDCDGVDETIQLAYNEEDMTPFSVTVTDDGLPTTNAERNGLAFARAFIVDVEAGDGHKELIITGDMASDDYTTYIYRYEAGTIRSAEFFGEAVDAIGNGRLAVRSVVNVLGTYGATCTYSLQNDFSFLLDSVYTIDYDGGMAARSVTLQKDGLPASADDGQEVLLSKGTELTLMATDEESFADLVDADGNAYRIQISRTEEDWQWYIGGVAESDWFGELMYAG